MKLSYQTALVCLLCTIGLASCKSAPKETAPAETTPAETTVKEETPATAPAETTAPAASDFSSANTALLTAAETARQESIVASAPDLYADAYNAAEKQLEQLKKDCAANPSTDYSAQIKDVTARYQALTKAAQAQAMKKKIDDLSFASYDQSSYDAGGTALDEYAKLGADGDSGAQLTQADKAYNAYLLVLTKAFKALAGNERKAALDAKKNADSVKAAVSQKDAYAQAADAFKKADSDYVTQDIEKAYQGYKSSKESFASLYDTVSKARAAAQEAIDNAKKAADGTKSYASEADTIAPLGDGEVKGIEAADKKMLEDDQLANPDDAVIDVNTGATAKAAEAEAAAVGVTTDTAADTAESAKKAVQETK